MLETKKILFFIVVILVSGSVFGQKTATITINTDKPAGIIDPKIYGQLFEHIYFSADGGLWGEMITGRSFEPEQYPGIAPRDGYFNGWYADDEKVLHSPTLYEQPIPIITVEADKYIITTDIKWRGYRLARHMWSGGYADMRMVFKNSSDSLHYRFRIHDPQYESANSLNPQNVAKEATFAIEKESISQRQGPDGTFRKISVWEVVASAVVKPGQIDKAEAWHNLYIDVNGKEVSVKWDNEKVLNYYGLESSVTKNNIEFGVNYTESQYKNIQVSSTDRSLVYMSGMPKVVINPDVAPQWKLFGNGTFRMVKGDAINMKYSQKITAVSELTGIQQGPFYIKKDENYIGSVWAKGDGKAELYVAFHAGNKDVAVQKIGKPGTGWKKYEFKLAAKGFEGDASLNIGVKGGSLQVDQVSMMSQSAIFLGGFRPDIYKAVEELAPTNLRWPGGGYAAQYSWKWGVGPQEKRERWAHYMWMNYDQNDFGTDEFLQLCHQINSEPVLVIRIGFDRPVSEHASILQEAVDWVAYCNEPASGKWGSQRAANGHPEPYNVKYWEIDNEMWEFGLENYEAAVREFSVAMRKVDPGIKIIVCGGFGNDEDKGMIERSGKFFDYMSLHHYESPNGYATGPGRLAALYQQYADMIAACPNPDIKLYISEWNLSSIDWRTGLFAGGFLNVCEKQPAVEMGAAALFIRRTDAPDWNNAFINFDYKGLFVAPNYLVTKLWHDNFSKNRLSYTGETGDLSVSTTLSEDGKKVIVKLVNATDTACELKIKGDWKSLIGASYYFIAPGSLMTTNSMESPSAVKVEKKEIQPADNIVTIVVAPLSAGVLKVTIALELSVHSQNIPNNSKIYQQPVTLTSEQDHENMMQQLDIKSLRPGPSGNERASNHANYDESAANPCPKLPDVLTLKNGKKVTTGEIWWKQRRPEIIEDFEREIYGRLPNTIPKVIWTVKITDREFVGRTPVIAKQLVGHVDNSTCPSINVDINMMLVVPVNVKGPVPVLMMFGRPSFPSPAQPSNIAPAPVVDGNSAPTEQLLAAGWGYVTIDPSSIQADNGAGLTRGIIGLVNKGQPRKPDDWGSLRAWAWGAARGLDYLETDSLVDAKKVGIEGVSRYGKAALVTLAFESRFATGLIGSSGKGGAALHRRVFGEAVENLSGSGEYHWMAGNYIKYAASEAGFGSKTGCDLTVDSHELIALCAPRLTFISYGIPQKGDAKWLDQQGSYMAAVAAGAVFKLLGAEDLGVSNDYLKEKMPPVLTGLLNGELAWRQHDGGHTDAPNFQYFIPWASKMLKYNRMALSF